MKCKHIQIYMCMKYLYVHLFIYSFTVCIYVQTYIQRQRKTDRVRD